MFFFFFFFKQKTAYEMCGRDWSSDVCSSDLNELFRTLIIFHHNGELVWTDAEVYVYLSKNKLADVMFSARRLQHHEITQHNRITLPIKMVDGF